MGNAKWKGDEGIHIKLIQHSKGASCLKQVKIYMLF